MTQPGLDTHKEILVRLQVNDVCKSWYSLISSGGFVKSQLNYNLEKKVHNNEIRDTRITALCASASYYFKDCLVGSSNGLVCISRYIFEFLVVNPSTREVKVLRNPRQEYNDRSARVSGFGYDSSIDDYKVVIGFKNKYTKKLSFKVLTLKSNIWRSVAVESDYHSLCGNGIIWNGAIHWYSYDHNGEQVLVSFDLSKEVFKEIPQPELGPYWELGTMKDCLCIFSSPYINRENNEDIEIWAMRSYNVQESWERKLPYLGWFK
ncbi:putative F-box domain-containing protein [Tanacetum coccineum]